QVRAETEGQVFVRAAVDVEGERVLENRLVPVGRRVAQHQPVALPELPAADLHVLRDRAQDGLHRARPAYRLVDKRRQQRGIRLQAPQQAGLGGQCPHRRGGRGGGGIVSGGRGDDVVAIQPVGGDGCAVDLGVDEDGGQVVRRVFPP